MESATVIPPYVAKPLRLGAFRAEMLAPARVGDPSSARALARPYRDVAQRLTTWIERGWAVRDSGPAIYLHEYTAGGVSVRGLVGVLDVSQRADALTDRAVWPHEAVHRDQAADLAARMEEMRLNPAPILLVHDGDADVHQLIVATAASTPTWSFVDHGRQQQRIWAIRDTDSLDRIAAGLADTRCLIADGHHRYAAYLTLQEKHPGTAWDAGLAMVVDQADTPLFLGPIHRSLTNTELTTFESTASRLGAAVARLPRAEALKALAPDTLVCTDGAQWRAVRPHTNPASPLVEWLHQALLPALDEMPQVSYHHDVMDVLGSVDRRRVGVLLQVSYHHDVMDVLGSVDRRRVGVLLPGASFAQVRNIVAGGRLLPEKATSFQPKPSLGVIMRRVDDA